MPARYLRYLVSSVNYGRYLKFCHLPRCPKPAERWEPLVPLHLEGSKLVMVGCIRVNTKCHAFSSLVGPNRCSIWE